MEKISTPVRTGDAFCSALLVKAHTQHWLLVLRTAPTPDLQMIEKLVSLGSLGRIYFFFPNVKALQLVNNSK